jgi:metal-responsive CopG/Arc/MetJ family transcriptional regulator
MSLPDFNSPEIEDYRNRSEIIRLTAEQVIKDFALFGMEIHFSGNIITAYDELFEQLNSCMVELLSSDYRRLLSLLYHIDISEKEMNKKFANVAIDHSEIMTEMIIERELKKVIIRKFYKG